VGGRGPFAPRQQLRARLYSPLQASLQSPDEVIIRSALPSETPQSPCESGCRFCLFCVACPPLRKPSPLYLGLVPRRRRPLFTARACPASFGEFSEKRLVIFSANPHDCDSCWLIPST